MNELILLLPELFLVLTLCGVLASEITYHGERARTTLWTVWIGFAGAFVQTLLCYRYGATQILNHSLSIDAFSLFFKLFFIVMGAIGAQAAFHTREIDQSKRSEYTATLIGVVTAACLVASASDLFLAFLALQAINLFSYLLGAFNKKSHAATEGAIKHLIFGALAGGLFLYAMGIVFSATHTVNIYELHRALTLHPLAKETSLLVFIFMLMALGFQMGAFPMHLWVPDVLEGVPTPVSALVAVASRAAGFAFALRFFIVVFAQPATAPGEWQVIGEVDWTRVVAVSAAASMILGSMLALKQTHAKRLIAYLVIAQSGFLLMGLLVLDQVGLAAILYNLLVELFALAGAYYLVAYFYGQFDSDKLSDLRGALTRGVPESICLILFLICLIGLPPFPGFIGKFTLLGAGIRHQWYFLSLLGIFSAAVSTVAVARLALNLVGDFTHLAQTDSAFSAEPLQSRLSRRWVLAALVTPLALITVFAERVLHWVGQSLHFILW